MKRNPVWAELIQLLPIVSLALPIVLSGEVDDLSGMGVPFVVATVLAIGVTALIWRMGHVANPILVGTSLWLAMGAVAFGIPVAALAETMGAIQAFGLFVGAGVAGVVAMATPTGAIGARGEPGWVRSRSLVLLGLTVLALAWAWAFRHDVRLGGGLPFIALNVARRVMIARR